MTPSIIQFLHNQNSLVMSFCIIGGLIMAALATTWMVIHFSGERLKQAYDGLKPPVGSMLMAGFVLYVALVVSSVLRDRALAEQAVDMEAHTLHLALSVLNIAEYPAWHQAIGAYINKVTHEEWDDMRTRKRSHAAHDALQNVRALTTNGLPTISPELRKQLLEIVNKIDSSRRDRLHVAGDEVPEAVWFTLSLTAMASIFFCATVHVRTPPSAYLMAVLYGIVIGSMFFTIFSLDQPFNGPNAISAQPIASLTTAP